MYLITSSNKVSPIDNIFVSYDLGGGLLLHETIFFFKKFIQHIKKIKKTLKKTFI
jgi:hypothetical protein